MKIRILLLLAAVSAILVSCGEKPVTPETPEAAPVLVSSEPAQGATDVPIKTSSVILTYDQNVKCPTSSQGGISISNGASVTKVSAYGAAVTVTISGLDYEKSYTLSVPAGAVQGYKTNQDAAAAVSVSFTTEKNPDQGTDEHESEVAWNLAAKLGLGWNMGNHMDALYNWHYVDGNGFDWYNYPNETVWGNDPCTQATFNNVKKAGFASVRIPVTWMNYIGPAPDYKIDETWMNRVYEIVGYAHNAGLNVIVNMHHDENHGDDHWQDIKNAVNNAELNTQIKDKIRGAWTQIANKFKDCGDWLILEGFNEINDGGWGWSEDFRKDPTRQCNILNEWNQVFVSAVRATGGNNATRWLGVPTYAANPAYEVYAKLPDDPAGKTMISVHFYDPSDYTIGEKQYTDWGHTGAAGKKADGGDEDHVQATFNNLTRKYVNRGIPVYIGEFGCSMRAQSDSRAWAFYLYYMEYVAKAAKTYGLPAFLWDNGAKGTGQEQHGYINHADGAYIGNSKTVIDLIVKATTDATPSYTLQSVYDRAPKF
jgi:endoglucanase